LVVYSIAILLKQDKVQVLTTLSNLNSVEGRFQYIKSKNGIVAIVDYAHTPDALENALKTLGQLKNGKKIITVFGCGGDRDQGKRPLMGEIACRLSDQVILTSDNPRTEYPGQILEDIAKGCKSYQNFSMEIDRKKAIEMALSGAQKGDAVLVAGKGHEDYQIIGKTSHPFSDVEVIKNYLK
jgi:UDP-N-acetylmuramoyl-L-alanyl-D-glutamate--2,6-diaminopimelate ligase